MYYKLFVDGRVFDTQYQGTRTYIQNLYAIIDKIGGFEIFIGSQNPDFTQTFFPGSKNIRFIPYKTKSKISRVLKEIPAIISDHKIAASHFQYVCPIVKNNLQIVTIHDILFKDFPEEFDFKYKLVKGSTFYLSAKRADLITTVSEYSRQAISKYFKIPEKEIFIVPNGVSDAYFEAYDKNVCKEEVEKKFGIKDYLLYTSRIEPRKNQIDLLKAFLQLKLYEQNKSLVFIGNYDIPVPEIDETLNSLSPEIRKYIYFLSNVSDIDLRLLYKASSLFVYPSKAEGFGIPPLESAALGIPTICSNSTAMADYTFFGENHIKPKLTSIIESIKRNLNGSAATDTRVIQETIKSKYTWEHAAEYLAKLIIDKLK